MKDPATKPALRPKKTENKPLDKASVEVLKTQNHLLALALLQPKLRIYLTPLKPHMMVEDRAKELLAFLEAHPDFNGETDKADTLRPLADYVKMLSLLFEELYQGLEVTELHIEATRLQAHLIDQYVKIQKGRIAHELQTANETRTAELLTAVSKFDQLLRTYKGGA
jgi:hypothetical protein